MASLREPESPVTVEELKQEQLYGVLLHARGEAQALRDEAIKRALVAAEDFIKQDLRVLWKPTRIFSNVIARQSGGFDDPALALPTDYDPKTDLAEAAYDYPRDIYTGERWGQIALSFGPVQSLEQMVIAFPGTQAVYKVPRSWIQVDQKFRRINLVPTTGETIIHVLNAWLLSIQAGARGVPQSIHIDYTAGYTTDQLVYQHQNLLEALRLRTLLGLMGILVNVASPRGATSGSLGMDGLSRSRSFGRYGPYSGTIELALARVEEIEDAWKRHERGVQVAFV